MQVCPKARLGPLEVSCGVWFFARINCPQHAVLNHPRRGRYNPLFYYAGGGGVHITICLQLFLPGVMFEGDFGHTKEP